MDFDIESEAPCNTDCDPTNCDNTDGRGFGNVPVAPPDSQCVNPAYAATHPDTCKFFPKIRLVPDVLTVAKGQNFDLATHFYPGGSTLGFELSEPDNNLTYRVIGPPHLISLTSEQGKGVGLQVGVASIVVEYVWNGITLSDSGHVQVADCSMVCDDGSTGGDGCEDIRVGMLLVVDNSKSMSQSFASGYDNKLQYAKGLAARFAGEVNVAKDRVGLYKFSGAPTLLEDFTTDKAAVVDSANGIQLTTNTTDIEVALRAAVEKFSVTTFDYKVIVLISDGQSNAGGDAFAIQDIADGFKSNVGCIIIAVGVKAHNDSFELLRNIASGGFFLNAFGGTGPGNANAIETSNLLSDLKGLFCAGDCLPSGDVIVAVGRLNYTGFINWDVIAGSVDLIGGTPPYVMYDMLPGNGMYVDGCGSPGLGTMRTKDTFPVLTGKDYKLSVDIAGNQREDRTPDVVRVKVWDPVTLDIYVNDLVTITDYLQDFTTYDFDFTAAQNGDVVIEIGQESIAAGGWNAAGSLWDNVLFVNETDVVTLLDDDFNDENLRYIPPRCGLGALAGTIYGGVYGAYFTYGGVYGAYYTNCYFGVGCMYGTMPMQLPAAGTICFDDIEN